MFWKNNNDGDFRQFTHILAFAKELEVENPNGLIKLVNLLLRPLQADLLSSAVMNELHAARAEVDAQNFFMPGGPSDIQYPGNYPRLNSDDFSVRLNRDPILPCPWHRNRYQGTLGFIGTGESNGEWRQDSNHSVLLLLPWGIPFVTGGNHSIAAGVLAGEGLLKPTEVFDLSHLLDEVRCDGRKYVAVSDGRVLDKVRDVRIAAIFEIGRMMRKHNVVPMLANQ